MKTKILTASLLFFTTIGCAFSQSIGASAYITVLGESGSIWSYDIHLQDTGGTNLGTLWYGWNPGKNFLPDKPTSISAPTGWSLAGVTNGGTGDGFGIRWNATTSGEVTPGSTLDGFTFSSVDSPTVLDGNTTASDYAGQNQLVGDSFVYAGAAFSSASDNITIQTVPEPNNYIVLGFVSLVTLGLLKRKK